MKMKLYIIGIIGILLAASFSSLNIAAEELEEKENYLEITNEDLQKLYLAISQMDDIEQSGYLIQSFERSAKLKDDKVIIDLEIFNEELHNRGISNVYFFRNVKISAAIGEGNTFSYWPLLYTNIEDGAIEIGGENYDSGSVFCFFWIGINDLEPVNIDVFSPIVIIQEEDNTAYRQKLPILTLIEQFLYTHPTLYQILQKFFNI
jgi:uncharacterized protein YxeA